MRKKLSKNPHLKKEQECEKMHTFAYSIKKDTTAVKYYHPDAVRTFLHIWVLCYIAMFTMYQSHIRTKKS